MTTNYQLAITPRTSGHISLDIDIEGWIIVGHYKNEERAFKVANITLNFDLCDDAVNVVYRQDPITVEPELRVQGNWCDSTGRKWQQRSHWWYDDRSGARFAFSTIPQQVKVSIYEAVEKSLREHVVKLSGDYKILTTNRGFIARPTKSGNTDEDEVFMSSVYTAAGTSITSPFEGHDVSRWAVARKELGLPKPKRKRKPKP